jgi:hypothetical protein
MLTLNLCIDINKHGFLGISCTPKIHSIVDNDAIGH